MLRIEPADHKGIAKRRGRDAKVRHKRGRMRFWGICLTRPFEVLIKGD